METSSNIRNTEEILSQFVVRKMQFWTPADDIIYGPQDILDIPPTEAEQLQFKAIKYAFDYHYSHNAFYRNFCQGEKIAPDDIKQIADFVKIPKIPDTFFKSYPSLNPEEIWSWLKKTSAADIGNFDFAGNISLDGLFREIEAREKGIALHSSGTTGKFSILFKNWQGAGRWGYMITKKLLSVVPHQADAHAIHLGPSKSYLGLGFLGSALSRIFPAANIHYSINRTLTIKMLLVAFGMKRGIKESLQLYLMGRALARARVRMGKLLQRLSDEKRQVYIISAPYELYWLMVELQKQGIRLHLGDSNSVIMTSAGWKIYEDERVSEEQFRKMAEETLGIPGEHCRDIYGMAEWHGFAWECEGHYKHIVQCTYPMVLDEYLKPLGYGEYGRFAFLDPASYTFPGFIITGDRVKMLAHCPVCNRASPVLEPEITRMPGATPKGCGNLMGSIAAQERR